MGKDFVSALSRLIIACTTSAPESTHDSQTFDWGDQFRKVEVIFERTRGKVVVDSAFCRRIFFFNQVGSKREEGGRSGGGCTRTIGYLSQAGSGVEDESVSRQLSANEGPLFYEKCDERKLSLVATTLLFNYRARLVGFNQIQSTFMPLVSVDPKLLHSIGYKLSVINLYCCPYFGSGRTSSL